LWIPFIPALWRVWKLKVQPRSSTALIWVQNTLENKSKHRETIGF
jgi:hypothetical protein